MPVTVLTLLPFGQLSNSSLTCVLTVLTAFTLLEQKILLITGFTHIRLETLGSIKFSAVINKCLRKERYAAKSSRAS